MRDRDDLWVLPRDLKRAGLHIIQRADPHRIIWSQADVDHLMKSLSFQEFESEEHCQYRNKWLFNVLEIRKLWVVTPEWLENHKAILTSNTPFEFMVDEVEVSKERPYVASTDLLEKRRLWILRKTYRERLASKKNPKKAWESLVQLITNYADLDLGDPEKVWLDALLAELGPHTNYFPPAQQKAFSESTSATIGGVGALLTLDHGKVKVKETTEGSSSAAEGGLVSGDQILAVDQVKVQKKSLVEVVAMIKGEVGTTVALSILRRSKKLEVNLVRQKVDTSSSEYSVRFIQEEGKNLAWISIHSFFGNRMRGVSKLVREELQKIQESHKIDGVVFDLRGNPGGLLLEADLLLDQFISTGVLTVLKSRSVDPITLKKSWRYEPYISGDQGAILFDFPVVVLVNRLSASASEILAGGLQAYRRAIVVSTDSQTFGKGSAQVIENVGNVPGSLKFTSSYYYLPNGMSPQNVGVVPDVLLETDSEVQKRKENYDEMFSKRIYKKLKSPERINVFVNENNEYMNGEDWGLLKNQLKQRMSQRLQLDESQSHDHGLKFSSVPGVAEARALEVLLDWVSVDSQKNVTRELKSVWSP